ncbi:signal peptidase I [Candidatus Gottesmanbacteria bacterium CG1_02_37_22]|uniref:Signal peptidase I n=1 Tax=Candidatus Gottesmanbacteria bacterium CG1_02_37_22 TaxID=1805209 RepID=A0A1J4TVB8_9BACT|nr:MAG: signal peptidase I [Candidatus Gottesmanbacteria bacterium CG1_02_37_22]
MVHFFFDFLETIVVALSIFVVIYLFFVQPHEVKGSSMEPNFHNNEFILTDKISYRFQDPKRGDVIIFRSPNNPDVDYIKRIIALPGEKVKAKNGYIYVDETKLSEKYLNDLTFLFPTSKLQNDIDIIVPQDEYFVLGDNRPHSSDSREFGPISRSSIIGKAFIRYWPLPLLGVIPEIKY